MTAPRYVDLATLLLQAGPDGMVVRVLPGYCTAWSGTAPYPNTVSAGATQYTNLPVMFPSLMATGQIVLVKVGDSAPFILGRIYVPA